jgi:8-oxo-dGTP pyrophosphatase MutT (NUDIX family)
MENAVIELFRRAESVGGYEVLAACTPGVCRQASEFNSLGTRTELIFDVDLQGERFARTEHPSAQVESSIESRWQARSQLLGDQLWNASKFRLAGINCRCRHASQNGAHTICLQVGLTDYRSHQGTTLSPNALTRFQSGHPKAPWCHLANAIGNAGVLETRDGWIVCQRRNERLGEASGLWVLPGGHPEPANLDLSLDLPSATRKEFFDAVQLEICDELNLNLDTVTDPVFLGLVRRKVDWRPTYVCWTQTSLTAEEVEDRWMRGGKDTTESTALRFLDCPTDDELLRIDGACRSDFFRACGLQETQLWAGSDGSFGSLPSRMVEDHQGALFLYWIQRLFRIGLLPSSHQICEYLFRSLP